MPTYRVVVDIEDPRMPGVVRTNYYVVTVPAGRDEAESVALLQLGNDWPEHRLTVRLCRPLRQKWVALKDMLERWGVPE